MLDLLVGLDAMTVLEVVDGDDELVVTVESTTTAAWCRGCGERAVAQDRVGLIEPDRRLCR